MRVRVLRETQAYWNYAIQAFKKDEEFDGDLARHLADNAPKGAVEVLEADPEPAKSEPAAGPKSESADDPESGDGPEGVGPPVEGTIDDLMKWVGDDKARASEALASEQAKDKPRSTVVKRLTSLAGDEE